ncbi:multicomponent K+:H+ antiporter subunit E [Chitinivorax tropicus]|uniref:Multicomponent K+:H+ antiporter subunit E n=1 Tax=Chitinivorax tropicus TaxID=714531 RepID=A0A840MTF4_9PROT|nr:Na+/H+ antiporter subunit E [Chitinivorax tropicus]MBB5019666.1 multicomponent K+:H+ antiporter subunit E [Chitinivorax tropicus]
MRRDVINLPLSAVLLATWLLLNGSLAVGHVVFGLALGLCLPWLLARFRPPRTTRVRHPLLAIKLAWIFAGDILLANLQVARLVMFKARSLRPELIYVPLDTDDPTVTVVLSAMITLTPGTVTLEADAGSRRLIVHVLHTTDPLSVITDIKTRYEQPLKEIFGC